MIEKRLGVSAPKDIKEKYYSHLFDEFKKSLKAVPGIDEALAATPYPKCVASSGEHEKIQFSLGITGLLPKFKGRIFSATDVENGKPAPDLFLHAAEKCNANPQYCAVIEDQAPGVKAGVAAGMRVFAYVENTDLSRSDTLKKLGATVFNNMKDLPRLLKEAK